MKRTLSLRREALTALTTDEMTTLAAAGPVTTPTWIASLDITECFATTQDSRLHCNTWDTNCSC